MSYDNRYNRYPKIYQHNYMYHDLTFMYEGEYNATYG